MSRGPLQSAGCPAQARHTVLPPWLAPASREPRLCLRIDEEVRGQVLSLPDLSHSWHPYPHALGNVWLFFKLIPLLPARSDCSVQHRQGCGPKHGEEGLFEGSKQRKGLGCCCCRCYQGGRQTKLYTVAHAIPTPRILEACCVHSNWTHLSDPLNLVIIFVACFAKIHIKLSFNDNATVVP